MPRQFEQMTPAEQSEYNIHKSRVQSAYTTKDEKTASRLRIDELEWKGAGGAIKAELDALNSRLDALADPPDEKKASMTGSVKKAIQDITERLDQLDFKMAELEQSLTTIVNDAISEAKTAIQAEAVAAATAAVTDIVDGLFPAAKE